MVVIRSVVGEHTLHTGEHVAMKEARLVMRSRAVREALDGIIMKALVVLRHCAC